MGRISSALIGMVTVCVAFSAVAQVPGQSTGSSSFGKSAFGAASGKAGAAASGSSFNKERQSGGRGASQFLNSPTAAGVSPGTMTVAPSPTVPPTPVTADNPIAAAQNSAATIRANAAAIQQQQSGYVAPKPTGSNATSFNKERGVAGSTAGQTGTLYRPLPGGKTYSPPSESSDH